MRRAGYQFVRGSSLAVKRGGGVLGGGSLRFSLYDLHVQIFLCYLILKLQLTLSSERENYDNALRMNSLVGH